MTNTQEQISIICDGIKQMLIAKNEDYGNSFQDPIHVFSSAGNDEQLRVRIDDKIKRLQSITQSGSAINFESVKDTVQDLVGYLILWLVKHP
jgi:hypothetical protein